MNIGKCKLIVSGGSAIQRVAVYAKFTGAYPSLVRPVPKDQTYFGSPLTSAAVPEALEKLRLEALPLTEKLDLLPSHQAI